MAPRTRFTASPLMPNAQANRGPARKGMGSEAGGLDAAEPRTQGGEQHAEDQAGYEARDAQRLAKRTEGGDHDHGGVGQQ